MVAGLADTFELPREALIIPRFFDAVLAGVGEVVNSVDRWKKPDRSMFDTEARTASDLFGEAALAFRALAGSIGQLWGFQKTVAKLLPPASGSATGGPMTSVEAVPDLFERVTRYIVAGLTLITIAGFVRRIWTELSVYPGQGHRRVRQHQAAVFDVPKEGHVSSTRSSRRSVKKWRSRSPGK